MTGVCKTRGGRRFLHLLLSRAVFDRRLSPAGAGLWRCFNGGGGKTSGDRAGTEAVGVAGQIRPPRGPVRTLKAAVLRPFMPPSVGHKASSVRRQTAESEREETQRAAGKRPAGMFPDSDQGPRRKALLLPSHLRAVLFCFLPLSTSSESSCGCKCSWRSGSVLTVRRSPARALRLPMCPLNIFSLLLTITL